MRISAAEVERIAAHAAAAAVRTVYAREFNRPTMRDVTAAVAEMFNIPVAALHGPRQNRHISTARQVAYFLCGEVCQRSSSVVGAHFCRDHSTVLYGQERIRRRMAAEPWLREAVDDLTARFGGL